MAKLPLGKCPHCQHDIWDDEADLQGCALSDAIMICIYCAGAQRYEITAGRYVPFDVMLLDEPMRGEIIGRQLVAKALGAEVIERWARKGRKAPIG